VWFGLLALPFAVLSVAFFIAALLPLLGGGDDLSLPFAGTSVLLASLAFFLVMGGALGELIYTTGDTDMSRYSGITAVTFRERRSTPREAGTAGQARPGQGRELRWTRPTWTSAPSCRSVRAATICRRCSTSMPTACAGPA
jgi:hypothetical protein